MPILLGPWLNWAQMKRDDHARWVGLTTGRTNTRHNGPERLGRIISPESIKVAHMEGGSRTVQDNKPRETPQNTGGGDGGR